MEMLVDGDAIRSLTYEELEERFRPLIYKLSHTGGVSRFAKNGIPGMDADDFEQEVKLMLWQCQQRYRPEDVSNTGFAGRKSSFFNYFVHAVENKFGKLRGLADKHHRPVTELECVACKLRIPAQGRTKCVCGGRRWTKIVGADILSVEGMYEQYTDAGFDPPGEMGIPDDVQELLRELPVDLIDAARQVIYGETLSASDAKALRTFGAQTDLPPELAYQKSIRRND